MFANPSAGCVETKYNTIDEIEVMTIDREVKRLDQFTGKYTLFVTVASGNAMTTQTLNQLT